MFQIGFTWYILKKEQIWSLCQGYIQNKRTKNVHLEVTTRSSTKLAVSHKCPIQNSIMTQLLHDCWVLPRAHPLMKFHWYTMLSSKEMNLKAKLDHIVGADKGNTICPLHIRGWGIKFSSETTWPIGTTGGMIHGWTPFRIVLDGPAC